MAAGILAPAQDESKRCCTTYDTGVCLVKVLKSVDGELNKTYAQALEVARGFGEQDVANLKDAQRKWVGYRNAACKAEYGLWGKGTGGPNAHALCIIKLTRQRTADLKDAYLNR